jgi:hypothetical protein
MYELRLYACCNTRSNVKVASLREKRKEKKSKKKKKKTQKQKDKVCSWFAVGLTP